MTTAGSKINAPVRTRQDEEVLHAVTACLIKQPHVLAHGISSALQGGQAVGEQWRWIKTCCMGTAVRQEAAPARWQQALRYSQPALHTSTPNSSTLSWQQRQGIVTHPPPPKQRTWNHSLVVVVWLAASTSTKPRLL